MKFYIADLHHSAENEQEKQSLGKIEEEVKAVYQQTRLFMHELSRSAHQQHFDLWAFLSSLREKFSKSSLDIKVTADRALLETALELQQQNYLYLIIKESLSNIMKYAHASLVEISIHTADDMWHLLIRDNGSGIKNNTGPGLGLNNIRDRITEMKGTVSIASSSFGTTISASFPRKKT